MSLPRYEAYKETGDPRIPAIPAHWSLAKLKTVIERIESGTSVNASDEPADAGQFAVLKTSCVYTGEFDVRQNKTIVPEEVSRATCPVRGGTLVVSRMNTPDLIGAAGYVERSHDEVMLPDRLWQVYIRGADPRFIHKWTRSSPYRSQVESVATGTSSSMKNLGQSEFGNLVLAMPCVAEQKAISSFLDRETAKIDALVAEQERLMALLREKRHAVISHAVTKGVNPAAAFRASGVRWLGDIPAHWGVGQSRRRFRLRNEPARADDRQLTASQKHGVILQEEFMRIEEQRVVQVIKGADILKHVEPNDFVISMRSFQGGIERSLERGCISSAYVMLCPDETIHGPFFAYLFKSRSYIQALQATSNLVRDGQALRFDNFAQVDLPLVPIEEQVEIARFLDDETKRIDDLIEMSSVGVGLLLERRAALVTAAVTGQIDVRHLATADAA